MSIFWYYRRIIWSTRSIPHCRRNQREMENVIGVTRATGKLLVTSLFKGVGTLKDAQPWRKRNSTWEVQQGYKNRWEFQLEWSSFVCPPAMRLVFRASVKSSDSTDWKFWTAEWMSNFRIGTSDQAEQKFSWERVKYDFLFLSTNTFLSSRQINSAVQETDICWVLKFSKTL